jgi:hypothetical protein
MQKGRDTEKHPSPAPSCVCPPAYRTAVGTAPVIRCNSA